MIQAKSNLVNHEIWGVTCNIRDNIQNTVATQKAHPNRETSHKAWNIAAPCMTQHVGEILGHTGNLRTLSGSLSGLGFFSRTYHLLDPEEGVFACLVSFKDIL